MAYSSRFHILLTILFLVLNCISALSLPSRQATFCTQSTATAFNLIARYKDRPTSTIAIKVIDVNTVPKVGYSILSACPSCTSIWSYNTLESGAWLPKSASNPYIKTVSYSLIEGESPCFISTQFPPPPVTGYCFTDNLVDPAGAAFLAAKGHADQWSLCPNSTANGRADVVWSPKVNHPHYIRDTCQDVYLEQV